MPMPAFLSRLSQAKTSDSASPLALLVRLLTDQGAKHWKGYAFAMAATAVVAGSTTMSAWIIKDVINQIFVAKKLSSVWAISAVIVAIYTVKGFSTYAQT